MRKSVAVVVVAAMGLASAVRAQDAPLLSYRSANGFLLTARSGGRLVADSPWGESVWFQLTALPDGASLRLDDTVIRFHADGTLQVFQDGSLVLVEEETQAVVEAGMALATPSFWEGLGEAADEYTSRLPTLNVGCAGLGISCFYLLLGSIGSVGVLIAACGVPVLTPGCFGALALHISSMGGMAGVCGSWLACLDEKEPEPEDEDEGHEGPREAPAQG